MTITIFILILILLAPLNVAMDWSSEGLFESDYWNKGKGWIRKYKSYYDELNKSFEFYPYEKKWYHFGFHPKYAEKFPYSTTIFVLFTDGWHLLQFLFHSTWQLAISLTISINGQEDWYYKLAAFIVIKITFSLMFETLYKIKKK